MTVAVDQERAWDGPEPGSPAGAVRVADVVAQRVEWLWPGRLPLGKVGILDGDPGLGKSTITLDLCARVSQGRGMPDGQKLGGPRSCLVISAEDGVADTVRPRLEAAGADLERILFFDRVSDYDEKNDVHFDRPLEFPKDLPLVQQIVEDNDVALAIIDPLLAFLGIKTDSHRDQDVRRVLYPLAKMAETARCAVLCLRHLNKAAGANPLYRGGGSIGFIGAARIGLLVAPDPQDDKRRVLAVAKSNLAAIPDSLAYRLELDPLRDVAYVRWEKGPCPLRACDLLRIPDRQRSAPKRDRAEEFLSGMLADGPRLRSDVEEQAAEEDVSWRTVERAKTNLGILTQQVPVPGHQGPGPSWWYTPDHNDQIDAMNGPPPPDSVEDGGPFIPHPTEDESAGQEVFLPDDDPAEWSANGNGPPRTPNGVGALETCAACGAGDVYLHEHATGRPLCQTCVHVVAEAKPNALP